MLLRWRMELGAARQRCAVKAGARRALVALLFAILASNALLLSGCSSVPVAPVPMVEAPVWPRAPEEPRIRYLRSVTGPTDWGVTRSWWQRLVDAVTGGREERFVRPTGVAVLRGVLYVADPGAHALWILDADANSVARTTEIGGERLVTPVAVAPGGDGSVFVADSTRRQVFRVARDGRTLPFALEASLQQPVALAFDPASSRLYVADARAHQVLVFDERGRRVGIIGGPGGGDGQFNRPTHLALDRAGLLLVTDALNFRVQAFDLDGRFAWKLGAHGDSSGEMAAPKGVAVNSEGRVVLVDALFDAVQLFDHDGTYLLTVGGRGEGPGQFWLPNGLYIDAQDRIFVADAYNRRVQVLDAVPDARKEPIR